MCDRITAVIAGAGEAFRKPVGRFRDETGNAAILEKCFPVDRIEFVGIHDERVGGIIPGEGVGGRGMSGNSGREQRQKQKTEAISAISLHETRVVKSG
jgi:hypothetical protein